MKKTNSKTLLAWGFSSLLVLASCSVSEIIESVPESPPASIEQSAEAISQATSSNSLDPILAAQDDAIKARYQYRHPKETLEFFGVEPGMTVIDILPGAGWYSKILLPFLGEEGSVIGLDYDLDMWRLYGGFANEEFLEKRKTWPSTWASDAEGWSSDGDAMVGALAHGNVLEDMTGKVDLVMMVRAFHHYNRFEEKGGFLTAALQDLHVLLKPGGIVGVVQHRAPEDSDDEWANGDNGYVKQSHVISTMEAAGFKFIGSSEVNANPKDQPTKEDFVWRLPPVLSSSREDPELRAQMIAIGETDRMTLKFVKISAQGN